MAEVGAVYGAADVRYPPAVQAKLTPPRLQLALAIADTLWRPADRERITVLDIGCGRGLTACLLAAANPGWDVIGLDLQPAHVAEAREVAAEAGLDNARFIEADLAALDVAALERMLPELDVVICYGLWTWVPDAVRAGIVRLLGARVKPGGIVAMGYNALPGFADAVALQRLLAEAARGVRGGEGARAAAAIAAVEALRAAGALHLPADDVLDRLLAQGRRSPAYFAHEWLTDFWRPVFHADLARDLAAARLDYGGAALPAESLPEFNLSTAQRDAVAAAPGGFHPETLGDLFLERRFRTDVFVRGRRGGARGRLLPGMRVALTTSAEAAAIRLETQAETIELEPAQSEALLAALGQGPRALGELAALPALAGLNPLDLALLLTGSGVAAPVWRDPPPEAAARAARFNAVTLRNFGAEAAAAQSGLCAAVPMLGAGVELSPSDLAVLVALQQGVAADPAAIAARLLGGRADAAQAEAAREATARLFARRLAAWRGLALV